MSNVDTQTDYAAEVVSRLSKDYAELMNSVATTLANLRALPKSIDDESTLDSYATVIRDARDLNKRIQAIHDAEKIPFLRSGQGVDQWAFGQMEKLARRKKDDPAGGIDIADARVDDYMQRKLTAERAERARIEAEERAKADAIRKEQEDAARAAAEAAAKAARARNAETIAAHQAEAARQAAIAEEARQRQALADQQAEDARIDTIAKPADMTRTRLESGAMATMNEVPFVQIDDASKLDMAALWPHLKEEAILSALKSWAKVTGHKKSMAGATIKMVPRGQVR